MTPQQWLILALSLSNLVLIAHAIWREERHTRQKDRLVERHAEHTGKLCDRIMSRNYEQYSAFSGEDDEDLPTSKNKLRFDKVTAQMRYPPMQRQEQQDRG